MKKTISCILLCLYFCMFFIGCKNTEVNIDKENVNKSTEYNKACNTPFGKYPETITYTLGKMIGDNNANMPKGDTYENNAYTRYLKEMINVQNVDIFEATDRDYNKMVTMAISEDEIPDIMLVNNYEQLKILVQKDMIEDLSDVYEKCASNRIKDIYNSYGKKIFNDVKFKGKLMAIPNTEIDHGPNMLWLRKDWMDKLNLKEPKTLKDAEYIISQFIEKDPGNNGKGNTIGLVASSQITGEKGHAYMNQLDVIFANFNSYPKQWIKDKNGKAVYGSVLPESKKALAYLRNLYKLGILDNKFLLREQNNIRDLIVDGKCGSFFGLWWAPNNPLMKARIVNKNADWRPYIISTNEDGSTSFCSQNPSYKYVVVRKGYQHPELVMKIISVLFDKLNGKDEKISEMRDYYRNNVDPISRPFGINVDYKDALTRCYENLNKTLKGEMKSEELQLIEDSFYEQCNNYLKNKENASTEEWAAYMSRIEATSLLDKGNFNEIQNIDYIQTETMSKCWWKLKDLEIQAYLKIITGEEPIDYFDEFVVKWYEQGGLQITKEINDSIQY